MSMNRIANATNPFQGDFKRVLCCCSAGLLRSPTAAVVLSQDPFNFNTRACGLANEYALIPLDRALLSWAQEIVVMEPWMVDALREHVGETPVICLDIPDNFKYRDPELMAMIAQRYKAQTEVGKVEQS